jgi:DKNYY family
MRLAAIAIILAVTSFIYAFFSSDAKKNESESVTADGWRKLQCGLFMHTDGRLAFASAPQLVNKFITTFGSDYTTQLRSVIDTATFEALPVNDFYKDKNRIYSHYAMCDGGYFTVFATDTASFVVYNSSYFKYQGKVMYFRGGAIDADAATFKASSEHGMLAKDKYGFFEFGERITEEVLREQIPADVFTKLKAL